MSRPGDEVLPKTCPVAPTGPEAEPNPLPDPQRRDPGLVRIKVDVARSDGERLAPLESRHGRHLVDRSRVRIGRFGS